jgi:hypothetical protein
VKDHSVVIVDITAIYRSFALPNWTSPFAKGITANSQPEIGDTKKLKLYSNLTNQCIMGNIYYEGVFSYVIPE